MPAVGRAAANGGSDEGTGDRRRVLPHSSPRTAAERRAAMRSIAGGQ